MKTVFLGLVWLSVYLGLVLAPLLGLLIGSIPPGRGFWWEFSAALGYSLLSVMGLQFALTARFKRATAPFGIDIIYYFHRQVSVMAFLFLVLHVVFLSRARAGYTLGLLNPFTSSWSGRAGLGAMLGIVLILTSSLWRRRLGIPYERWRLWHGMLAVTAVSLAVAHVLGLGYYIAAPWKRVLWASYALFWVSLIVYVRLVSPWMMLRRPYVVEEVRGERGRAWTLALVPLGHEGMGFRPGQFAWLTLRKSPFSIEEHPFSFSSSAVRPGRLEFTIKELGDFTSTIKNLRPGERAYIDGPYGSFSIDRHPAPGYVFIAGGIGIAPIMSMLRTLADRGSRLPLLLIYATRSLENATFLEEIGRLRDKALDLDVAHVLEEPPESNWQGEAGFLSIEMLKRLIPADWRGTRHYFICGPDPMMDAVEKALFKLGVPITRFHSERFNIV